ncbi:MAG: ADP-forming succinate--CoA ligase subunit beta [Deltaproteobacteria bacterium]|nr:ADP-forming succinate--CoA ligase subunit beta [Deltaproteobacteria bacterium]
MKLHEYQAKDILRRFSIPVPAGYVAESADEAGNRAGSLNGPPWVVKAQVHAGGRGKAGGVRLTDSIGGLKKAAEEILNRPLISEQTGPEGKKVNRLLIEEGVGIERELYLAVTVDRSRAAPVIIFSRAGGMDIEEIAGVSPELLIREYISPDVGWSPYIAKNMAYGLDPLPEAGTVRELMAVIERLYRIFIELDCSLVEINPLVITKKGNIMALDAKINIDDNALFRRKDMAELDDPLEKEVLEREAEKYNLNYIRLNGNIGAMVNGAGLAMATMDLIKMAGAEPANFLDVGGGASEEMVRRGLEIILEDEKVKAILINIFGGILRCDVLARGVLAAARKTNIRVPVIVRLEGTNVEEGRKILKESDLRFMVAKDMNEAADLVTRQVSG